MFFDKVERAPLDPIFGLLDAFATDPRKEKVNLMIGVYKDENLKSELFSSILLAKEKIQKEDELANYFPIDGYAPLKDLLGSLVFGSELWSRCSEQIYIAQSVGGTGALRLGADFLLREVGKTICIPNYTWPNHALVFQRAGFQIFKYPYYSHEKKGFDLQAMLEFFDRQKIGTVILLHACCQNPTGCDPSAEEWMEISKKFKERQLFPFFDFAYQGLGIGVDEDAFAVRLFLEQDHEMAIAYSCSKNFSMYCQRVGACFLVGKDANIKSNIASQIKPIIRSLYSNPPSYGARIVSEVLKEPSLKDQWLADLQKARNRMISMREELISRLDKSGRNLDFCFLKNHKGMFSFLELNQMQVQTMMDKFAIYMTDHGRISITGLCSENIDYVVKGLIEVCAEH
jgi:aspartate/tyrosine/aromatic aminotransferase